MNPHGMPPSHHGQAAALPLRAATLWRGSVRTGPDWGERAAQRTWRTLGTLCFGIGAVNAFVPLLPTTVFLLMGLWAFGKADPGLRDRLLSHPRFGPGLRAWVERREISRSGKVGAALGIAASGLLTAWAIGWRPLTWAVLSGLAVLALWLVTRREPQTA